jgi:hypothetical protein
MNNFHYVKSHAALQWYAACGIRHADAHPYEHGYSSLCLDQVCEPTLQRFGLIILFSISATEGTHEKKSLRGDSQAGYIFF